MAVLTGDGQAVAEKGTYSFEYLGRGLRRWTAIVSKNWVNG